MPAITSDFSRAPRLAGLIALLLVSGTAQANETPTVGHAAPALVARQFDGQVVDLAALRGQVVLLNFWASWCTPCRAEMPQLDALAQEFHDRGLTVIGLSADDRHDRADALKAAKGLGYPLGMLSEATRNEFGNPRSLPLSYVIDRDGVIRTIVTANRGPVSIEGLRSAVIALLP
jgi:cytochrome c biogenesis protein CcmG, thiol:disulfide interchange protein DsbE